MWFIGRPWVGLLLMPCFGSIVGDDMMKFLENTKPISLNQKLQDEDGEDLKRPLNILGTLPDADWEGMGEKKVFHYDENFKLSEVEGRHFRAKGVKTRGSTAHVNKQPKPIEHQPHPEDPEGCGNPICVVIDRKPRRFASLCQFKKFLQDNSRSAQINFVQKGDCYDIIDNNEGAKKKPWSSNAQNCHACAGNPLCNGKIVVIIDILSFLNGKSSAPGGGQFKVTNIRGEKMSAFPFEFNNICEAMRMFESRKEVNLDTQVVGFALGCAKDLFSKDTDEKCVFTEWFDHDTACNSDKDVEMHSDHYQRLQSSFTGPYRICPATHILETQHEGGSEVTQVMAEMARDGKAFGRDNEKFKQHIVFSKTGITCQNKDQEPGLQLPPPFIYNNDGNNTCLDYKSRYCCRTSTMWRAVTISTFLNRLVPTLPVGLSVTQILDIVKGVPTVVKIRVNDGVSERSKSITLKFNQEKKTVTGSIQQDQIAQAITGTYKIIRFPDGTQTVGITIYHIGVTRTEIGVITIRMFISAEVKIAIATIIKNVESISSITQIDITGRSIEEIIKQFGQKYPGAKLESNLEHIQITGKSRYDENMKLNYITVIILGEQRKTIFATVQGNSVEVKKMSGGINVQITSGTIWQRIQKVVTTYQISIIVDSPPLAILFHECEWQDWTNIDYPDKGGSLKGEFELRDRAYNRTETVQHVCGNVPLHAHYIDAVTMDDLVPWYELRMNNKVYEVFKLSPFFGYACKDVNGYKEYCQDMKVRYCCEKKTRATWGDWGAWSKCTKTCGGGKKVRNRPCVADPARSHDVKYNSVCFGVESFQSAETKRRHRIQETSCNLEGCPEDSEFSHWSAWGRCSITCGNGFKKSTRSCMPAKNGGKACPDKKLHIDLYEKVEKCTQKDCETFHPTPWTPWSICSATCGEGVKLRKRSCMSDSTLNVVNDANCNNDPDYFNQQQKCKLSNCPIHGNWGMWSLWSTCSLSCVHHPSSKHPDAAKTKAYRRRTRYCSNPLPAYGGKKCARDEKYIFNANQESEEDRTDCITEDSPNQDKNVHPVPWCPEQCIYTLWGEWSRCSMTCIKLNVKMGGFKETTLENVFYTDKGVDLLPERSRIRLLVKPARYGGSCPEQEANYDTPGSNNGSIIMQTEQCKLCRKHCLNDDSPRPANERDIRFFEKFEYPDEETGCVGYCPRNCQLLNKKIKKDCYEDTVKYLEEKQELEEKEGKKKIRKVQWSHEDCFLPKMAVRCAEYGEQECADKITEAFRTFIAQTPIERAHFVKFRKKLTRNIIEQYEEKGDLDQHFADLAGALDEELYGDVKQVENLLVQVVQTQVLETLIEGLIGGKNCKNHKDQEITSRMWMVEKSPEKYTKVPYYRVRVNACHVKICKVTAITDKVVEPTDSLNCVYKRWAPWGAWGPCDLKCGDSGLRKRKRDCINTCTKEKLDNDQCAPFHDTESDKKWTDTYTGPCTPCPPEVIGTWSTWTQWSFNGAPPCSTGPKQMAKRSRKRQCIKKSDVPCLPTSSGQTEGVEEEKIEMHLPPCSKY